MLLRGAPCAAAALLRPSSSSALLRARRASRPPRPPAAAGAARAMAAGSPTEVFVDEDLQQQPSTGDAPPSPPSPLRYSHTMRSGRHTLRGDLMPAAGGGDVGPSPKELALLSLGLCTSMTVRMFADASRFPLDAVRVRVRENCAPGAHLPEVRAGAVCACACACACVCVR
jgi:hypothetical protein